MGGFHPDKLSAAYSSVSGGMSGGAVMGAEREIVRRSRAGTKLLGRAFAGFPSHVVGVLPFALTLDEGTRLALVRGKILAQRP